MKILLTNKSSILANMLKYLIIQLDNTSVSFCHYNTEHTKINLIPLDVLEDAIFWAMKENLTVQFLYPNYTLPSDYQKAISGMFHADIVSSTCEDAELRSRADVVVFDSLASIQYYPFSSEQSYVFRSTLNELIENSMMIGSILPNVSRINIVVTDVSSFIKENQLKYEAFLTNISHKIAEEYQRDHGVQLNVLTDRILLDNMNNCNAGVESITLCPDGKFYICPAFYNDTADRYSVGNLKDGLDIKNSQLYRIDHAPICRICDAFHCRRCVWLNRKMTLEVNTPSHEQCVMAHIERNASRMLLSHIRKIGQFLPGKEIPELTYLDPFDKLANN